MDFTPTARLGYANLWEKAHVLPQYEPRLKALAEQFKGCKARYESIQAKTNVPWWWIACVHERESSCDFHTYLGNGEAVIGSGAIADGRRTVLVPRGRGPFLTFEDGAIDALHIDGMADVKDWSIPHALYLFEKFNGFGYVSHNVNSPYVWSWTNLYDTGKFQENRHGSWFNPNLRDPQGGCAAMLKTIIDAGLAPELKATPISEAA